MAGYSDAFEHQATLLRFLQSHEGLWKMKQRDAGPTHSKSRISADEVDESIMFMTSALRQAEVYHVGRDICEFLQSTYPAMPEYTLTKTSIPADRGFVSFDQPIRVEVPDAFLDDPRRKVEGVIEDLGTTAGLRKEDWQMQASLTHRPEFDINWKGETKKGRYYYYLTGVNWSINKVAMEIGRDAEGRTYALSIGIALIFYVQTKQRSHGEPLLYLEWEFQQSTRHVAREVSVMDAAFPEETQETTLNMLNVISTLWTFLSQKIVVQQAEQVDRATRRRVEREAKRELRPEEVPTVRRIMLRKKHYVKTAQAGEGDGDDAGREKREYSCQWTVGWHWRQQWYASTQEHRPILIAPYLKGPEGKPLRPATRKIFEVVR